MEAIIVDQLTKKYPIYRKKSDRVKEVLHPFLKSYHEDFYALRSISFQVNQGETVGIIGTNGSGKSTLLKIISSVLRQTSGEVKVNGRVSSLLELGVGFDDEYTGLENIYINGTIMGYSREEMEKKLQEIIAFADIGDFIHQQVKTYSSGMLVRLAFSLAINVDPEILIIDEALAVGDIFFQAKCFHKLEEIKNRGTTVLFVSHDMASVKRLCDRVIWIERGDKRMEGSGQEVCDAYIAYEIEKHNEEAHSHIGEIAESRQYTHIEKKMDKLCIPKLEIKDTGIVSGDHKAEIISAYFANEKGRRVRSIRTDQECVFCMAVRFRQDIERPLFGVELETNKGVRVYGVNNYLLHQELLPAKAGEVYFVQFKWKLPKLHSGHYLITPAVASGIQNCHEVHHRLHNIDSIMIENDGYDGALIELDAEFSAKTYAYDQWRII